MKPSTTDRIAFIVVSWMSLVEGGWRWVEVGGGGWRWVEVGGGGWRW